MPDSAFPFIEFDPSCIHLPIFKFGYKSLCIFFTATFSGFCLESFDYLSENLSSIYCYTFRPIVQLLPQFDKFNPTKFLVPARLLSWFLLARVAGIMICIKAAILLLLALLIFSYREIAKIVV